MKRSKDELFMVIGSVRRRRTEEEDAEDEQ